MSMKQFISRQRSAVGSCVSWMSHELAATWLAAAGVVTIAAGSAGAQPCPTGAIPPSSMPIDPGEVVVTCCSGIMGTPGPGAVLDLDGYVVALVDARNPPAGCIGGAMGRVNWRPPMFHNENANPLDPNIWNGRNLGQVFGLALDNAANPNIYVAASTIYGEFTNNTFGPGGSGAIYRLDGTTGAICTLARLPNAAATGLGNMAFSPVGNYLYVSNFDDGLIYRVPITPCNQPMGTVYATYDHGVAGRTAAGLGPLPDLAGRYTRLGRRVWGVAVNESERRLYYSVWWEHRNLTVDGAIGVVNPTEDNEVWSVALDAAGAFVPSTARREFTHPPLFGAPMSGWSNPASDLSFTPAGDLMLAERTRAADSGTRLSTGTFDTHQSRVLKYTGASTTWTASPTLYRVGNLTTYPPGPDLNAAGGVHADCDGNVWASGDALHFPSPFIYGIQRIPSSGNGTDNPRTRNSFLVDLNDDTSTDLVKTEFGDVAIRNLCTPAPPSNNLCVNCISLSPGQAIDLVPNGATLDGSSSCLLSTVGCAGQPSGDVWYCVTPCCPQPVTVTASQPPLTNPVVVSVHTACPGTAANQVVCNSGTLSPGTAVTFTPTPGLTYYVRVAYYVGSCLPPTFSVSVNQTVTAPVNNACNPGTNLSGTVTDLPFTTCGATTDGPNGQCTGFNDIWYNYTPAACGYVTVSANTTSSYSACGMDPCIGIFCPGCPAAGLIACSHDTVYPCFAQSHFASVRFYAVAGRTYKIRLGSVTSGTTGSGTLSVAFAPALPPNDTCATATPIAANQLTYGSTTCANSSPIEFALCAAGTINSPDVWYSFSPACAGTYTIFACEGGQCGSSFDTLISVFSGCPSSDSSVLVACNDNGCPPLSIVAFNAAACQTYYIRVAGATVPAFGDFSIVVSGPSQPLPPPPSNNQCGSFINVGAGTYFFNTCGATTDGRSSEAVYQDIWYRYVPACTGIVTVSTCGSPIASDTSLAVYSVSCSTGPLVGFNDNPIGPCFPGELVPGCLGTVQSFLQFSATAGTAYWIRVGSPIPGNYVCGRLNIIGPNPASGTCPTGGVLMTRVFRVLGPSNNTPWAWCLSKACCFSIQNLNVPGEPISAPVNTSRNALAARFAASITAACPANVNLRAQAYPRLFNPGIFVVRAWCPSVTPASQLVLSVGSAGTPCGTQCVVAGNSLFTNGTLCSFNPPIEEIPLAGTDCNSNGQDDLVDVILGSSADVNDDLIPDECQTFCLCDINNSGTVTSQDFFDLLTGFFDGSLDYNHDGLVTSQDYFDFLTCFFQRPPGCN